MLAVVVHPAEEVVVEDLVNDEVRVAADWRRVVRVLRRGEGVVALEVRAVLRALHGLEDGEVDYGRLRAAVCALEYLLQLEPVGDVADDEAHAGQKDLERLQVLFARPLVDAPAGAAGRAW